VIPVKRLILVNSSFQSHTILAEDISASKNYLWDLYFADGKFKIQTFTIVLPTLVAVAVVAALEAVSVAGFCLQL